MLGEAHAIGGLNKLRPGTPKIRRKGVVFMQVLDCREMTEKEAVSTMIRRHNDLQPGERLQVLVKAYNAVRGGLLESRLRHQEHRREDGSSEIIVERGSATVPGSAPGAHHVISNADGDVWACQRGPLAARINMQTRRAEAVSPSLKLGTHLTFDPAGKRIIVPDRRIGELVALRPDTLDVEQRWKVPGAPSGAAASADGIICTTGDSSVTIVRPRAGGDSETQVVRVGARPHDPMIGSDGAYVFVPCLLEHDVVKVRLSDGQIMGRINVGHGPAHLASDPATGRLYVANSWDGTVAALNEDGVVLGRAESGGWAHAIDITPDGRWVWAANFFDDTVAVFDAATMQRKALLNTDPHPHGLNISPDGKRAVVTGYASSWVKVFDAENWRELAHIEVGAGPSHTAFVPGSAMAAIACSVDDHVACVDLDAGRVTDIIDLKSYVN
jgi:DNA-binding beta-propeller fold protein YncE